MTGNGQGVWRWVALVLGTAVIGLLAAAGRDITGRLSASERSQTVQDSRLAALEANQANILRIITDSNRKLDRLLEIR